MLYKRDRQFPGVAQVSGGDELQWGKGNKPNGKNVRTAFQDGPVKKRIAREE